MSMYGKTLWDFDAYWWQCSEYIPLIALLALIGLAILVAVITLIVCCNRVNFKHWLLERRQLSIVKKETEQEDATERTPVFPTGQRRDSLPKGKTDAYIIYNYTEENVLRWINQYVQNKLFEHPVKITLQFAAGPTFKPFWQQVKEHGFDVNHFLVIVTDDLLDNHWKEMSEKSGFENLSKIVLVLMGKKKRDLPKDLIRLSCPCLEWPQNTYFTTLQREREQFWKQLRLALKD
jgi:hypothetical protein